MAMKDDTTGLPKVLQDGDYFKLGPANVKPWMTLKYMRPRKYWFDRTMEEINIIVVSGEILSKYELYRKAEYLLEDVEYWLQQEEIKREAREERRRNKLTGEEKAKLRTEAKERRKRAKAYKKESRELRKSVQEENNKFYGKYPPKSLNG